MTTGVKKPKLLDGRVPKILKLPLGLHKKLKELAKSRATSVSDLYDQIVFSFLTEVDVCLKPIEYFHQQGELEKISIYLKEKSVDGIKEVAARYSVPENRVLYTAIVSFSRRKV